MRSDPPPDRELDLELTSRTVEVNPPSARQSDPPTFGSEANCAGVESNRTGERVSASPLSGAEIEQLRHRLGPERYTILGKVGEGGMASVYVARDESLRRQVALKLQHCDRDVPASAFLEEAQVLGQLEHPNIVPLYTLEAGVDGTAFSTMRYLRGSSLQDVVRGLRERDPATSQEYTLTRLMQIFIQITQAVSYAHNQGVIHRDLKPANVMLGEHGEVQVVDWGIAKVRSEAGVQTDSQREMTLSGVIMGTPEYMAPEQWAGAAVDERADIYSLGVMLYEMLTLRRPFDASNPLKLCRAVASTPPPSPRAAAPGRTVPLELEQACLKALAKDPEERQQQVRELYRAVQSWLETETDRARRNALAEEKVAEARRILLAYKLQRERVIALERNAREISANFKSWQSVLEKQELYSAEEAVGAGNRQLIDLSTDAVGVLIEALGFERENVAARELLADYYWDRMLEAEQSAEPDQVEFFARLVQRYHDGKYSRELQGTGTLSLATDPPGARLRIARLVERELRLVPEADWKDLGLSPIHSVPIEPGSYVVRIEHPGVRDVVYPVFISRNRDWHEQVRLYSDQQIGKDFVHVPGGPFVEGGDQEGWSLPRADSRVEDFAIARHPVTVREYLEFLNALAEFDQDQAFRRAPRRAPDGGSYAIYHPSGFTIPGDLPDGIGEMSAPVSGVSWHDALAYCEWRSHREGRQYRLPTASEWEKAARGVDGRWFPWGNRFDASLCNIRESMREAPRVAPVHAFPADESVYGVRGMAGNIRDWTDSVSGSVQHSTGLAQRVVRGGAWYGGRVSARCADRFWFEPTHVYFFVGFRLAHSLG